MSTHRARPTSEIFFQNPLKSHQPDPTAADHVDKVTEKWLADLEIYQHTLEEMASINLDQEFKDELNAVQQWFEVLSMGERTAALYALLQDSSQVQVRFFITVLKRMAQNDAIAGVLSPTTATSASNGLGTGIPSYDSYSRQSQSPRFNSSGNTNNATTNTPKSEGSGPSNLTSSPVAKPSSFKNIHRHSPSVNSNLSSSIITPQYITQNQPSISSIASLISPNLESAPLNGPGLANAPYLEKLPSNLTPWVQSEDVINRPKSADVALGTPAAHASLTSSPVYYKPPPSIGAGIKRYTSTPPPPGINISNASTQPLIPTTGVVPQDDGLLQQLQQLQLQQPTQTLATPQFIYPEFQGASWASMSNTPTAAMFSPIPTTFAGGATTASPAVAAASTTNGDKINVEIASATAMKMAALSTVSNRVILDHDVKKFRRNNKSVASLDLEGAGSSRSAVSSPITSEFGNQGKVVNQQLVYPPVSSPLVDRTQYLNSYSMALLSPVPPPQQHEYGNGRMGGNGHRKQSGLNKKTSSQTINSTSSNTPSSLSSSAGAASSSNSDPASFELAVLEDVPQWLKTLRLHKYTEQLKDLAWRDLVALSDAQLEARGVNALGARRKMLKVFEQVREADAQGSIK
ncbi:hypothetical protein DV113_000414 [Geotrichum candidum]|uniref:RNA-binding protein VTS1 n=1 Tax=Geotrichum candidum TaxID=1173061 RepID=A0A0J9XAQ3_GEOCN|nr:hypothetical protein DV454_002779 [Geotrichum candidum]KAF7501510.1 hypothetical protein DV113_000414 [Geotrichum candidum]KAI8131713.1 hypothetical protein DUD61_004622 [Geotrichum candidum]CDO54348.1 similar to Saccharomyces cerevisiae YOR359W VTS1 Flap-structured DNA-binding and RNA-binding protein [Geotrichum candidum]